MAQLKKLNKGLVSIGALVLLILLVTSKSPKSNRGLMGLGALIIFIAVILVAAIAAAVMLSTGGSLQQKALITGNEAREGVSGGFETIKINGADASSAGTPHAVNRIYLLTRLSAGSNPLNFNSTVITMDTPLATQNFIYNGTVSDDVTATGTGDYVITYIQQSPVHEDDYLQSGDVAEIKFNIDGNLLENMKGRITLIPRIGSMNMLEFMTPESMVERKVLLWPTT
jgi:flagellin-like protein